MDVIGACDCGDAEEEKDKYIAKSIISKWKWSAVTKNSEADNLRPIVVANSDYEVVLWLKGRYSSYRNYDLSVLALIEDK